MKTHRSLVLTALLHLETTEGGGATEFARAHPHPIAVSPRRGRLVAWYNHLPNGKVDDAAWHQGCAVTAGTKTTATGFFYRPLSWAARVIDAEPCAVEEDEDGVVRW